MAHGDITHIDIPVTNLEYAKSFYSTLFGWEIGGPTGFETYPLWQSPNGISGGGLALRDTQFVQPRSYVEVDSIDDVLNAAVFAGGAVVLAKQWLTDTSAWAVIIDPDGNQIGLFEEAVTAGDNVPSDGDAEPEAASEDEPKSDGDVSRASKAGKAKASKDSDAEKDG